MILVNGKEEKTQPGITLAAYLSEKQYRTNRIAAELNGQIVPKSAYENTLIKEGDRLEIVSFVGGG